MSKARRILKNPLFLVLPVVAVLLFGWYRYIEAQAPLNSPLTNILPNGGLDDLDDRGLPIGWQFSGGSDVTAKSAAGHESPKLLILTNGNELTKGSTTLTSPLATIKKGETYLFKGFYLSTVPFDLIMRTNNQDGSHTQAIVGHYRPSDQWTTASYAFTQAGAAQTVQFIYSFAAKGELQVDNTYLEPHPNDIFRDDQSRLADNLIPNDTLASSARGWRGFTAGENHATNTYVPNGGSPFLRSKLQSYKSGEAEWHHTPVSVHGNQVLQFTLLYRSDVRAELVADYTLASGKQQFVTLGTLLPAADWTSNTAQLDVPPGAVNVEVAAILRRNGTLDTKNYGLYDISKSDTSSWQRPLVSYTFDDGWKSSFTNGAALLEKNGYRGTFYVNPSAIDTTDFMTSSDVTTLRRNGHELASHGYAHLDFTTLTSSAINYQLERAYQYFDQVYGEQTVDFATPYGSTDPQVAYYARKYYASLRGAVSGVNTRQNFDPYNLRTFYVRSDLPLSKLSDALAETKARHGWLILIYHQVDTAGVGGETITPEQFQQQLDLVKQSGITVEPVDAALGEVRYQ